MNAATSDRTDLILAAQTGDAGSIERLLAVCQADARRYAQALPRQRRGRRGTGGSADDLEQGQRAQSRSGFLLLVVCCDQARVPAP